MQHGGLYAVFVLVKCLLLCLRVYAGFEMRRFGFVGAVCGVALLGACLMPGWTGSLAGSAKTPAAPSAEVYANGSATCPLPEVLQGAAKRVQESLGSLERFAAKDFLQEEIKDSAHFIDTFTETYDYVAEIEHPAPNQLVIKELRHKHSNAPTPDWFAIADGLPAISLIFSDAYSGDYLFQCDGASNQHGKAAWKVSFEQRPDREPRVWSWTVGGHSFNVRLKGHAWIAADSYELLRVEADVIAPPAGLGLNSAHIAIEYAPVNFTQKHEQLWLISSAEIATRWATEGQLSERHRFSDFTLFSVAVESKITPH
jgi:hypothetical protein